MGTIAENVAHIREELRAAALEAGRDPDDVLLIAATKMNDASRVQEAIAAGVDVCGENRVQEMLGKLALGAYEGAPLHFIGHLQKNKAKQVVGVCSLIHSVDSRELLQVISRCAENHGIMQDVLLEVNIGEEESKSGFSPEQVTAGLSSRLLGNGEVFRVGVASFLAANLVNNIPMSVLFSSVTAPGGVVSFPALYAAVIGSNIGAFFTPMGALAGIMWMALLKQHGVELSFGKFVLYGAVISLPTLFAALGGLALVL